MVGTIPIVISSSIDELYKDLPVIIVNSWDVITVKFLNKKYDKMIKTSYNLKGFNKRLYRDTNRSKNRSDTPR